MRIELIDTLEDLKAIKDPWRELMARSSADDFFLLPQWIFAWWSAFSSQTSLFFVAVWQNHRLEGLFPLVKTRKGPFRVISLAGLPRAGRMDFLLADDSRKACLNAFLSWLYQRKDWDLLSLRAFGPFSGNPHRMKNLLLKNGKHFTLTQEEASYYIPLQEFNDFDHYLKESRSAKTRKSFRRKKRKLTNTYGARWEQVTSIPDALVDEMAGLDRGRSIRGQAGRSFFSVDTNTAFLKALIKELESENRSRAVCLRIEGDLQAFDLLFVYHDKALSYQTAFDSSLYSYGVGNLTLLESLKFSYNQSFKAYDFLTGDDSYKRVWADQFHQNWRLQVYGRGLRSRILLFYHRVIKPLRRKLNRSQTVERFLARKFRTQWDI